MSVRRLIVEVELDGLNVRRFCAEHGVSTWFFYALRRRFAAEGAAGIEPRSRAPHRVANRTPDAVEDAIVVLRKELLDAGLDAGAGTIWFHLHQRDVAVVPSESTIWRVLSRRGFVVADPSKAPRRAARSFAAARANECWQTDDTAWSLADGTGVKIVNVIDDCTRVAIASHAAPQATASAVFGAFIAGAGEWGWPEWVLCDNAKAHRHGLTTALNALGIRVGHSRPYHPQTCGKVERFHQTLQRYLRAHDAASSLTELQDHLDAFRDVYNHRRPHRALGRKIPAQVWNATPKSGPDPHQLDTPTQIHRVRVAANGTLSAGRRWRITIGSAYANTTADVIITATRCHVFIDGHLARQLTLDPTRRDHPLTERQAPRHV